MVTAGLKCPPLIGPNIYAMTMTVRPTADGIESDVLAQLIEIKSMPVPSNSKRKTKNLF